MVVKMAKKMNVQNPPPTLRASHAGTRKRRVKRAMLENCSLEGPSAGRGAFLMAGYCVSISIYSGDSLLLHFEFSKRIEAWSVFNGLLTPETCSFLSYLQRWSAHRNRMLAVPAKERLECRQTRRTPQREHYSAQTLWERSRGKVAWSWGASKFVEVIVRGGQGSSLLGRGTGVSGVVADITDFLTGRRINTDLSRKIAIVVLWQTDCAIPIAASACPLQPCSNTPPQNRTSP